MSHVLAIQEICQLSTPLLTEGTRQHEAVASVPTAAAALPVLQTAVDGLLALSSDVDVDVLADEVRTGVEKHDQIVRTLDARLESEAAASGDDADRSALVHARDQIFPQGQAVIRMSAAQKGGEAQLRARRVTSTSITMLGTLPRRGGGTMGDTYAELQSTAAEVGTADANRRAALVEQSGPRVRDAKKRWTQAISLIELALQAAGHDPTTALGAIRAAPATNGTPATPTPASPTAS